jgi:cyclophilin family peptidyl-prolyl cis-trans isomerase
VPPARVPLAIASGIVAIAAIVAIAVGVNRASTAVPPSASPTATPVPTPTPTPVRFGFADCSTRTFGAPLTPLHPPATVHVYSAPPAMSIDARKLYQVTITTPRGSIVLCLQPRLAPTTVNVFVTLARNHYFDGIPFHRVCPNPADSSCGGTLAIIQGGDPNCIGNVGGSGCGSGGPGFHFKDELVHQSYVTGAVAMANSGPNTNGSQFFVCTGDDSSLPPSYNLFGNIESGLSVAQALKKGDAMQTVTVAEQT